MIVELVARTVVVPGALERLGYVRHPQGNCRDCDELHEAAGRECYQSWGRPNPKTATNEGYLANILNHGHYSTLEHSSFTFSVREVSRATTHELVRHRHLSPSQISQRYVDESHGHFVLPPEVARYGDPEPALMMTDLHQQALDAYEKTVAVLVGSGIPRKRARQAARAVLPNGHETRLLITGNTRAWREFVGKRIMVDEKDEPLADLEMHDLACHVLWHLNQQVPNSVQDLWKQFLPQVSAFLTRTPA
jgi:thymidylate synthase (FAD)